jgi:hypothetical protein
VVTPAGPHPEEIDEAFAGNHDLRKRVHAAIGMPSTNWTVCTARR